MARVAKPDTCRACPGWQWGSDGFMPAAEGGNKSGVLLVGEALGTDEAAVGKPFQGKAGLVLTQMLQRAGLSRDEFLIDNALRCQPPGNRLNGEPYEYATINHCRRHVQSSLDRPDVRAIVPMGEIAFQRVCGLDKQWKITPARGYIWRAENGKWAVPAFHPSYIMRGKHKLRGVFLADLLRAKRVAANGFRPAPFTPVLDPLPSVARAWADLYLADPSRPLAYDIETPHKADGTDEGELEVDDPSYVILRVGFAYEEGSALSVPFTPPYYGVIRDLLSAAQIGVTWNSSYDNPRLIANGFPVPPTDWDMMWGWHVLNSDLPKGLAFVAPLYRDMMAWKHLSKAAPALYNAHDAEVTIMLAHGIKKDLESHGLWNVFDRHVVQLTGIFQGMSRAGMPIDPERRSALSRELQAELSRIDSNIAAIIPDEAKQWQTYKKAPKDAAGIVWRPGTSIWKVCSRCGLEDPKKGHFKATKKKPNACAEAQAVVVSGTRPVPMRAKPWVPSVKQLTLYAKVVKHRPMTTFDKRSRTYRVTFDDDALRDLLKKHPQDPLYPLVRERREVEKLLSTYVGIIDADNGWSRGMPIAADGKIHTTITNTPSTLRTSSQAPNLQNIPSRGKWAKRVKDLFVADPGCVMVEIDYSAIEAVLVGYDANSRDYVRAAKLGVHDFLNSHMLARNGIIPAPAQMEWSDGDLKVCFKDLKSRFKDSREAAKRIVHGGNYGMSVYRLIDLYPEYFPGGVKEAAGLQALYFEIFPDIQRWQDRVIKQADKEGFLRNPYGYLHRFWQVFNWEKKHDEWVSSWGEDAKRALAFGPQGTAAAIIKEAILRIRDANLHRHLRLLVHDSLVFMLPAGEWQTLTRRLMDLMTMPNTELPLDPAWGMGDYLSIGVEAKAGPSWGSLEEFRG